MEPLDILMICHNNELYFQHIFPILYKNLESLGVHWYIYENNSTDNTVKILERLDKKLSNMTLITQNTIRYKNKYINITLARTYLTNWYFQNIKQDSKWVIWLDTNIILDNKSILTLLESSRRNPLGKMFTSFTNYIHNNNISYYYDILAYNYGKFFRTSKSPNLTWDDIVLDNFSINQHNSVDTNNESKILTGFGGLALICRESLKKTVWKLNRCNNISNLRIPQAIVCEHWAFQKELGCIYMVKNTDTLWFMDSIFQDNTKINEIKKKLEFF